MKKSLLTLSLMLLTAASGFAQSTCKVLGTTPDIDDGETIYLEKLEKGLSRIDSTVVENGQFAFSIPATKEFMESTILVSHRRSLREGASTRVIIEPDATLKATLTYDYKKCRVYGSPLNYINNVYSDKIIEYSDRMNVVREAGDDETLSEADRKAKEKEVEAIYSEMVKFQQDFAYQNLDNILGAYLVSSYSMVFDKDFTAKCLAELPEKWNDYEGIIKLREALAVEAKTAEGQPITDFTMPDPKGKDVSLSQFIKKNKLTLVDFWASWCGPCRKAIPGVKALYEKYRKQGFGVVGVSFDSKKEAWVKAIKDLDLPWPQMSDLKGWDCAASDLYNIKAIPFTLLVTKDGTIVARNIDGEELLEQRIQEYLK